MHVNLISSLLFEEVAVQRSVRSRLHRHLQHLHTFLEPGVSCAKPRGFKSLRREEESDTVTEPADGEAPFCFPRTHCGELVRGDFLLALCDGVEEQILQAGQDARLPSPAAKHKNRR